MNKKNLLRDKIIIIIEKGKKIFDKSLKPLSINHFTASLKEESSLSKERSIFSKMAILVYSRVVFKYIFYRLSVLPPTYLAFTLTMTSLISCRLGFEEIPWLLLGIGFLSVGLSHGVLDYLTDKTIQSRTQFLRFILVYLLKGALLGLVWIALPDIALFVSLPSPPGILARLILKNGT
ncbi:hypothetical protein EMGBS15_15860 [Filimonas sp.]|nr:hypothetical protein EMGBS15_15860 [Filimonas sp.]